MKKNRLLNATICLFAHFVLTAPAPALAANLKFDKILGQKKITACDFAISYVNQPKDYYCRMTSINLKKISKTSFALIFTNELGQPDEAPLFTEYSKRAQGGITEDATFKSTATTITWSYHYLDSKNLIEILETYTFDLAWGKDLSLKHEFSHRQNKKRKIYTWAYKLY